MPKWNKAIHGSSLALPAHGWAGARSSGGQKIPSPDPLPFCLPERKNFSKIRLRIFAKKSSNFVQGSAGRTAPLSVTPTPGSETLGFRRALCALPSDAG